MTRSFTAGLAGLTIAAAAVAMAGAAAAQAADGGSSIKVRFDDLNVASAAGAQVLLDRIDAAAAKSCGGAPDIRLMPEHASFEACRKAAIAQAVTAVDQPMLTAAAGALVEGPVLARR